MKKNMHIHNKQNTRKMNNNRINYNNTGKRSRNQTMMVISVMLAIFRFLGIWCTLWIDCSRVPGNSYIFSQANAYRLTAGQTSRAPWPLARNNIVLKWIELQRSNYTRFYLLHTDFTAIDMQTNYLGRENIANKRQINCSMWIAGDEWWLEIKSAQ